jgi:hypothetical protein
LLGADWTAPNTFLETDFLGFTLAKGGAPPNPIGAFLPSTQAVDLGAAGFFVLTADLGTLTVPEQNKGTSPFSLNLPDLPTGAWVIGDLITSAGDVTTAQSSALFVTNNDPVPGPEAGAGLPGAALAAFRLLGFASFRRRRNNPNLAI